MKVQTIALCFSIISLVISIYSFISDREHSRMLREVHGVVTNKTTEETAS